MNVDVRTFSGISERAVSVRSTNMAKTTDKSINQLIFIRQCNYKQTTKKCGRLPEHAIAQQSYMLTDY